MAQEVISVEPTSSGFLVRYSSGGCRSISAGPGAQLIHYTNDGITYKQGGKTHYFNFATNGVRVFG